VKGLEIVHCGECGQCTNDNDITIMKKTNETLTKTTTRCALRGLFLGAKQAESCVKEQIGFTQNCSTCWNENIQCTLEKCVFTCLKSQIFREPNNNGKYLNSCLECDEKLCGSSFLSCAGANRRRLGIQTDIQRDESTEVCGLVDKTEK